MTVADFTNKLIDDFGKRTVNSPMASFAPNTAFNKQDECFLANVASYRQHLMSIIDDRKNGKTVSYGDTPDLLSIMNKSDFFKDKPEKMIDELIGMFMAGMKTT